VTRYTQATVDEILSLAARGMPADRIAARVGRPERAIRIIVATGSAAAVRRRDRRNRRVAQVVPVDEHAAAQRQAHAERRRCHRAICPPGIKAEPFSEQWFQQNEASFAAGFSIGRAREAAEREERPA